MHTVAEGHEQDVAALAVQPDLAQRRACLGRGWRHVGRGPLAIAVREKIAAVVARDGLEEDAHAAILLGQGEAGAQQARSLSRMARDGDDEPGDVPQDRDRVVVVEVTAEATLVRESGDPDDHSVAVLTVGEEAQGGGLAAKLVLGVVQVREVLDLGHGHVPRQRRPERDPEDGLLIEQGVEDPVAAEALPQCAGDSVHPALDRNVLAEDQGLGVGGHQVHEGGVDGLGEGHPWPGLGQAAVPCLGAVLGGQDGRCECSPGWGGRAGP